MAMDEDDRRCTASQLFKEEEQEAISNMSTYDRVVGLLNDASLMQRSKDKLGNLKMVQELIINKDPGLLDNFLDEMLAFLNDKSIDVQKFIISFMEEASKKDPDILPKIASNLEFVLQQKEVQIVKKVILTISQIYKVGIKWLVKAKTVSDLMQTTWQYIQRMKTSISEMIDSDNDGIRTHAIKFLEAVVLTLTRKTSDSDVPKAAASDLSLEDVPENHVCLKVRKLEEEGRVAFEALIAYMASAHISSVNLMMAMGSMTAIAKQRPAFITRVVQGFETLHVNLPPTLSKSQVSSVRKHLKMQLLALLKHPSSIDMQTQVTTLLTDLGATQAEVMKALPKVDESRKRAKRKLEAPAASTDTFKKPKLPEAEVPATPSRVDDDVDDDYGMTPFVTLGDKPSTAAAAASTSETQKQSAIDVTAEDLISRLTPQNVADLVLLSMVMLPDAQPAHFQSTYTPIAAAGTQAQIKHLARLLATQLTAAGLGKGIAEVQKSIMSQPQDKEDEEEEDDTPTSPKHVIQTVVGGTVDEDEKLPALPPPSSLQPPQSSAARKGIRKFRLSAVTQRLSLGEIDNMTVEAVRRILSVERLLDSPSQESGEESTPSSKSTVQGPQVSKEICDQEMSKESSRHEVLADVSKDTEVTDSKTKKTESASTKSTLSCKTTDSATSESKVCSKKMESTSQMTSAFAKKMQNFKIPSKKSIATKSRSPQTAKQSQAKSALSSMKTESSNQNPESSSKTQPSAQMTDASFQKTESRSIISESTSKETQIKPPNTDEVKVTRAGSKMVESSTKEVVTEGSTLQMAVTDGKELKSASKVKEKTSTNKSTKIKVKTETSFELKEAKLERGKRKDSTACSTKLLAVKHKEEMTSLQPADFDVMTDMDMDLEQPDVRENLSMAALAEEELTLKASTRKTTKVKKDSLGHTSSGLQEKPKEYSKDQSERSKQRSSSDKTKVRSSRGRIKKRPSSDTTKDGSNSDSTEERSNKDSAKMNSTRDSAKERSTSDATKEKPTSASRKERSTSATSKERSTSATSKERSTSDVTKEKPTSDSTKEISTSNSSKEKSSSASAKERSCSSSSTKERSCTHQKSNSDKTKEIFSNDTSQEKTEIETKKQTFSILKPRSVMDFLEEIHRCDKELSVLRKENLVLREYNHKLARRILDLHRLLSGLKTTKDMSTQTDSFTGSRSIGNQTRSTRYRVNSTQTSLPMYNPKTHYQGFPYAAPNTNVKTPDVSLQSNLEYMGINARGPIPATLEPTQNRTFGSYFQRPIPQATCTVSRNPQDLFEDGCELPPLSTPVLPPPHVPVGRPKSSLGESKPVMSAAETSNDVTQHQIRELVEQMEEQRYRQLMSQDWSSSRPTAIDTQVQNSRKRARPDEKIDNRQEKKIKTELYKCRSIFGSIMNKLKVQAGNSQRQLSVPLAPTTKPRTPHRHRAKKNRVAKRGSGGSVRKSPQCSSPVVAGPKATSVVNKSPNQMPSSKQVIASLNTGDAALMMKETSSKPDPEIAKETSVDKIKPGAEKPQASRSMSSEPSSLSLLSEKDNVQRSRTEASELMVTEVTKPKPETTIAAVRQGAEIWLYRTRHSKKRKSVSARNMFDVPMWTGIAKRLTFPTACPLCPPSLSGYKARRHYPFKAMYQPCNLDQHVQVYHFPITQEAECTEVNCTETLISTHDALTHYNGHGIDKNAVKLFLKSPALSMVYCLNSFYIPPTLPEDTAVPWHFASSIISDGLKLKQMQAE